jgi:hypothetical protein
MLLIRISRTCIRRRISACRSGSIPIMLSMDSGLGLEEIATNPYTNVTLPYTGYVHVDDYVRDVALKEMEVLADMGTEIIWCDIGGLNLTAEFASQWFNTQAARGSKQLWIIVVVYRAISIRRSMRGVMMCRSGNGSRI